MLLSVQNREVLFGWVAPFLTAVSGVIYYNDVFFQKKTQCTFYWSHNFQTIRTSVVLSINKTKCFSLAHNCQVFRRKTFSEKNLAFSVNIFAFLVPPAGFKWHSSDATHSVVGAFSACQMPLSSVERSFRCKSPFAEDRFWLGHMWHHGVCDLSLFLVPSGFAQITFQICHPPQSVSTCETQAPDYLHGEWRDGGGCGGLSGEKEGLRDVRLCQVWTT